MLRLLLLIAVATAGFAADGPAATAVPGAQDVPRWVALFNQDLLALDAGKHPVTPMAGAFDAPASDIAREVRQNSGFSLLVLLPFLILPQILLIYVIFKYRKKADGREPATFMGNHKLEIVWTAIPCVALVVVGVPMWDLLIRMDDAPHDQRPHQDMVIEVRGKQYAWDYKYQSLGTGEPTRRDEQFEVGQDVAGMQEPVVLVNGRRVIINLTSNDVNHCWWIPAFGVKQDAIKGRYTYMWFTPERNGLYKGQCAELCGQGHGVMLISALVVDEPQFAVWCMAQRHRADTGRVWSAISAAQVDAKALDDAVGAYIAKDASPERLFALRYWVASGFASQARRPGEHAPAETRRQLLETAINRLAGLLPART